MGEERQLVIDLIIIIGAATGGGVVASLLRLPTILGYLAAGLIVENYIPGLAIDLPRVQDIAELGVALLLFSLGVKFSFRQLAEVRRVAVVGGGAQIMLSIGLGVLVGAALGFDLRASFVIGYALALSSTMVVLKLFEERGEVGTLHGRAAMGILLVQDLAVVPMVILIGATAGETDASLALDLALAAGKALLLLAAAYVLGTRVLPQMLFRVAAAGSRELFLLAVLSLALGLAAGSYALGLSLAFGAFLAGLVVSESEFSYQTLADVLPLREVFATIFFVSMGMLIDPAVLVDDATRVAALAAAVVVGKLAVSTLAVVFAGYPARAAVMVGLSLAQMGEFSFVLARAGVDESIVSDELNSAILMSALVSMVMTPLLLRAGPAALSWAGERPLLERLFTEPARAELGDDPDVLRQHAVVCGYGRVGRELVRTLQQRSFRCIVVEQNPYLIDELRRLGIPRVYGDAANPVVLGVCGLDRARVLAVTIPDSAAAESILSQAKAQYPRLDIIARGRGREDHEALLAAGAAEVVHPEFEAGLEFVRHTLRRFGVDSTQIQAALARRRRDLYRR